MITSLIFKINFYFFKIKKHGYQQSAAVFPIIVFFPGRKVHQTRLKTFIIIYDQVQTQDARTKN